MQTGPKSLEKGAVKSAPGHLWMHDISMNTTFGGELLTLVKGEGMFLEDSEGRRYLDANAGSVAPVILGYGNKAVEQAVIDQLKKLPFAFQAKVANIPAMELAEKLSKIAPAGLERTIFSLAGSDANEIALKMARQYHANRGRRKYKVVGFWGKYLGAWFGTMSAGGITGRRAKFEPLLPGFVHVTAPTYDNCPKGLSFPEWALRCADGIEEVIKKEGPDTVGAVHTDVIDVHNGIIIPPFEYFRRVREICDRYEVLLIADEVITGIGRTGKMFACEHYNLVPDIMTLAKGITSGYQPLGATLVQSEIAERFEGELGEARYFSHAHTFGGNPVSCAAGLATLKEVDDRHLVERVATLGDYLSRRLDDLASNRFVHAIKTKGLLALVELFSDKEGKEKFDDETGRKVCQAIEAEMAREGILLHMLLRPTVSAYISPPYIISKEQIDIIASKLETSINTVCSKYS